MRGFPEEEPSPPPAWGAGCFTPSPQPCPSSPTSSAFHPCPALPLVESEQKVGREGINQGHLPGCAPATHDFGGTFVVSLLQFGPGYPHPA